jgi:hypothetical protein
MEIRRLTEISRLGLSSTLVLVASLLVGTAAMAQDTGGYGPPGGVMPGGGAWDGGGGRRMGRPPFDPSDLPSPEEIEGPPTPGTFRQLLSLNDEKAAQYTRAWDSLMAETKSQRDSARDAREAMRSAFRARNRDGAQQQAKLLSRLGKDLRKSDEAFDKSLGFLSNDERKQYQDYKKEQAKAREDERRRRFGGESGAGPPGPP